MAIIPFPLTKKTFNHMGSLWCSVLNRHESASIINFSPRTQAYRIDQFLTHYPIASKVQKYGGVQFIVLDIATLAIDFESNLIGYLNKKRVPTAKRLVLFIINADLLLTDYHELLTSFNSLAVKNFEYSLLYFLHQNILYSWTRKKYSSFSSLYQNCFVEPVLGESDQKQFYLYLSKRSRTTLSKPTQKIIMVETGGRMLLSSELVRQYAISRSIESALKSQEVQKKVEILWQEFLPVERDVIQKIVRGSTHFSGEEIEALEFLTITQIIRKSSSTYHLQIKLLEDYLKNKQSNVHIEIGKDLHLYINKVDMSSLFSKNDRVLINALFNSKDNTITRNTAAVLIWKSEEYTDWALDQFISRLRKKIDSLHLGGVHIITLKKRGYQLQVQ
ncbi:MAG: helix-turn-helix domain-containing protein [Patescibacteria group bacterium]